ncbi:hypothetical protein C2G38_2080395 [Gigaspora rosea]|uniref:Uncharacterized protein n=1 Tax=Gigaspora rosea TaxID=44941 RepID=A0A397VDY2_9GLOM|nr:hypothetical protein C2G38_2080395 [Gigaspora rosea]
MILFINTINVHIEYIHIYCNNNTRDIYSFLIYYINTAKIISVKMIILYNTQIIVI